MASSINCDLDKESGLVSITWVTSNDSFPLKHFLFNEFQESFEVDSNRIDVSLGEFLTSVQNIIEFWRFNKKIINEFIISDELKNLYLNIPSYKEAIENKTVIEESEVQQKLNDLGFKRNLKRTQVTNVAQISNLPGSADFSVPGAGKTTEALALFLLNRTNSNHKCLIVSPINAFEAWMEEVPACLGNDFSIEELSGDINNIRKQLKKSSTFFIINYEKLRINSEILGLVAAKISSSNFTIIADESHRMKGKLTSKTMNVLAPLCKHKIILSGTPCPQSYDDLISQFTFLYPRETFFDSDEIAMKFKPIYVRTPKNALSEYLPEKVEEKIDINYSGVLQEVWIEITKEIKSRKFNLRTRSDLRDFNKIVIKLIRFCANPQLVLNEIFKINTDLGNALADEGIGPKMRTVIDEAAKIIDSGEKIIIWSCFPQNIDIICKELELFNANPVKIYGAIKKGKSKDGHLEVGTRRHAIYEFKNNPECKAFVANPAAAGEGVSFHKVCRYALYNDRSYSVAHYLQSQDRIHRIGGDINKKVHIKLFSLRGMIDERITSRLNEKTRNMAEFLNDKSIISNYTNYEIDFENDEKNFIDGDIENANFDIEDYRDLQDFILEN